MPFIPTQTVSEIMLFLLQTQTSPGHTILFGLLCFWLLAAPVFYSVPWCFPGFSEMLFKFCISLEKKNKLLDSVVLCYMLQEFVWNTFSCTLKFLSFIKYQLECRVQEPKHKKKYIYEERSRLWTGIWNIWDYFFVQKLCVIISYSCIIIKQQSLKA